jgi:putative SOS response-associated peptidase YedK
MAFLTTAANGVVAPIHAKAMPVILRSVEECDTWLTADPGEALKMQQPLPDDALRIVARGEKEARRQLQLIVRTYPRPRRSCPCESRASTRACAVEAD